MTRDQLSGIDQKVGQRAEKRVSEASHVTQETRAEHRRFRRIRRVRGAIRNHPPLDITWRVVVLVLGILIIIAGVAMLALPGPGWGAIFLGLALLSTEFDWAQRILHRARAKMHAARERARDPKARRRMVALSVVVLLAAGAAAWWYVETFGIPVPNWMRR
jgi:uncharacterized protein (TIGR02611 family)